MTEQTLPSVYLYRAVVVNVYDGDTMRADIDLGFNMWVKNMQLRLAGIDTPELRGDERPEGLVARDFVRERLPVGNEIYVMTEKDKSGKYGRYIATIFYGSELTNLNEELIAEELARIVHY